MRNTVRQKRVKKARVIPGFRCTFGIVVLMLSLLCADSAGFSACVFLENFTGRIFLSSLEIKCKKCFFNKYWLFTCGGRNQYGVRRYRGMDFSKI